MNQLTGHHTDSIIRSADRLRSQAKHVHPVLAQAYRRRASELEFETWLRRVVDPSIERRQVELAVA